MAVKPLGYSPSNTPANVNLDVLHALAVTAEGDAQAGIAAAAAAQSTATTALSTATAAAAAIQPAIDATRPGGGRTVGTLAAYLANNAIFNPKDWGATGDGVTNDAVAIQAAIDAAAAGGGQVLFTTPAVAYNLGTTSVTIPARVRLIFNQATVYYSGTDYALIGGTPGDYSVYHYGIGIDGINLDLKNDAAKGIRLSATADTEIINVIIEGNSANLGTNRTNTGIYVDACIFTEIINTHCNHISTGLLIGTPGSSAHNTTTTTYGFRAFGDVVYGVTNSIGVKIVNGDGHGCMFFGGNLENCTTGIHISNPAGEGVAGAAFFGVRFEDNTTDILLGTFEAGIGFYNCVGLVTVTNNSADFSGYGRHVFLNCIMAGTALPYGTQLWNRIQLNTDQDEAVEIESPNANTAARFRIKSPSGGVVHFEVDKDGNISKFGPANLKIFQSSGSPEGAVTAPAGSLCLDYTGGAGSTLFVKESGTGNTGWIGK